MTTIDKSIIVVRTDSGRVYTVGQAGSLTPEHLSPLLLTTDGRHAWTEVRELSLMDRHQLILPIASGEGSAVWIRSGDTLRRYGLSSLGSRREAE